MNDLDSLNELSIGHKSIKIRLFYITFFFLFLVIGIVITQNVEGSVLSIFGLFIARLIVNFFIEIVIRKQKKKGLRKCLKIIAIHLEATDYNKIKNNYLPLVN